MNFSKQRRSLEKIKDMDMVDYLSTLGHHPTKKRNAYHWYLSPLRDEKTPSFKGNMKINRWYDHGMGKGVNITDFGILYHKCTLANFLQKIDAHLSFHQPVLSSSNGAKEVSVFEGFTDFPSFMVRHQNKPQVVIHFLVLNSVSFFENARPFMDKHEAVHLYLDNDSPGQNFSQYTASLSSEYTDKSRFYVNHKYLNDCLADSGNKQRKGMQFRPS